MDIRNQTWAVVATVDEPPALLQAFVAWHLHLGASEIYIYFDNPNDPSVTLFENLTQVQATRCDLMHWLGQGRRRPDKHQIRQIRNASDAYRRTGVDWLLHIDADEFLWPDQPITTCLDCIPSWIDVAVVSVAERVCPSDCMTVLDGPFRRPFVGRPDDARRFFGPDYNMTLRGLTGHAIGKSFVRTGRKLEMSIHRPKSKAQNNVQSARCGGLELLHFDGLTPLHWIYKILRKAEAFANHNGMSPSPHRQRQIDAVISRPDDAFALHDRLKCADQKRQEHLKRLGLWLDVKFDPRSHIADVFTDTPPDLSPAAADDWLWSEKGALLRSFDIKRRHQRT